MSERLVIYPTTLDHKHTFRGTIKKIYMVKKYFSKREILKVWCASVVPPIPLNEI